MLRDLKTIKAKVRHLLKRFPDTRDSDKFLIAKYAEKYLDVTLEEAKIFAKILYDTPSTESIRRVRQSYNEKGMFLPSWEVEKARKAEAEKVKNYLRNN